jgi:hypothetical protein
MERAKVTSNNDGYRTSYVITAAEKKAVEAAIEGICRSYHPLGYGTSFGKITLLEEKGEWICWICRGSRSNSCD